MAGVAILASLRDESARQFAPKVSGFHVLASVLALCDSRFWRADLDPEKTHRVLHDPGSWISPFDQSLGMQDEIERISCLLVL